ncbi:hypothetical protein AN641_09055 [Candidatus Epulonipiscioides gigas]|nr:hypothetical protein AN641_09055 [Epulopiscium sp. SCG-C07WGA-EpuloA2]
MKKQILRTCIFIMSFNIFTATIKSDDKFSTLMEQNKQREKQFNEDKKKIEQAIKETEEELKKKEQEREKNKNEQIYTQELIENNTQQQNVIYDEIEQLDIEIGSIEGEIQELDNQIISIEEEILGLESKIKQKEYDIEVIKKELKQAEIDRDNHYEEMKDRMVRMYKNNRSGYVEIIFSSDNLLELLNRSHYINIISNLDQNILNNLRKAQKFIVDNKKKLEIQLYELEKLKDQELEKKSTVYSKINDKESKITEREKNQEQKRAKINQLETNKDILNDYLEELEDEDIDLITEQAILSEEIKELIRQSQVKFDEALFTWPVPGWTYISSDYAPRINPVLNIQEFHQGIDIPATYGTPVVAAAQGRVIVAGWVNGFGYTIMIDHGDGLVSLYGHNSTLNVKAGDYVKAGQQVAGIGSTGYSTGNHSHFEVRVNGKHTSPWPFLGMEE